MRYLESEKLNKHAPALKGRVRAMVPFGQIPVIDRERARGRVYLDSAATTQKPVSVIEAVRDFYYYSNANVHRGLHRLSEEATGIFESARTALGRFINAARPEEEIIFCRGATEAINLAAWSWGNGHVQPGDEIVLTTMEHHSNLVPWQLLAARTGARLVEIKPTAEGRIATDDLARAFGPRTRLLGMTHVSNVLGTVNDLRAAAGLARKHGALFLVDGAQAMGHLPVDVQEIGCDLYAGSGHKMFGPSGTGFLYGRRKILETFEPFLGGGDMIEEVQFDRATYAALPARLEGGTPNMAGVAGLGAAVSYLEGLGMAQVREHDRTLGASALEALERLPWLEIYGPRDAASRSGLVSFNIKGVHAHDAGSILDSAGVAVRAGHLCAQPLLRHLGKGSCLRASFAFYNTGEDLDRLVMGLKRAAAYFGAA